MFGSRVKYITEDAASVCTWYLKFHMPGVCLAGGGGVDVEALI